MENREQLEIIRDLLQHKGWAIYKSLSQAWRQQKNREQADILRQPNLENKERAVFIQGEIDGSVYMENVLEDLRKQLTAEGGESNNPVY